jgi:hypothetical protein
VLMASISSSPSFDQRAFRSCNQTLLSDLKSQNVLQSTIMRLLSYEMHQQQRIRFLRSHSLIPSQFQACSCDMVLLAAVGARRNITLQFFAHHVCSAFVRPMMMPLQRTEFPASRNPFPEVAWTLHHELPLLVWLLPGHQLRLSNIKSHKSPITISGKFHPIVKVTTEARS